MQVAEDVGKGKWVSDWFGGDEVLKQIYASIAVADAYRRLLYIEPWNVLQPYFTELRIIFCKVGPIMVEDSHKKYKKRIEELKERINSQVSTYNIQQESISINPTMTLNAKLAEDLEGLHDDLLIFMQKVKLWIPSSYAREAQSKKTKYFGVKHGKPRTNKLSE